MVDESELFGFFPQVTTEATDIAAKPQSGESMEEIKFSNKICISWFQKRLIYNFMAKNARLFVVKCRSSIKPRWLCYTFLLFLSELKG